MYDDNHLAARLRKASIGEGNRDFLRFPGRSDSVSISAFFANAERMAAVLVAAGVAPGDRVAVQAPKTVAMLQL